MAEPHTQSAPIDHAYVTQLQRELAEAKRDVTNACDEVTDLSAALARAAQKADEYADRCTALEAEQEKLKKQIDFLEHDLLEANRRYRDYRAGVRDASGVVDTPGQANSTVGSPLSLNMADGSDGTNIRRGY